MPIIQHGLPALLHSMVVLALVLLVVGEKFGIQEWNLLGIPHWMILWWLFWIPICYLQCGIVALASKTGTQNAAALTLPVIH